jgi:hypothetical protein
MLNNEAQAAAVVQALPPASRAAGANNGAWLDVRQYEGDILLEIGTGAVTGSVAYTVEDATDGAGTGAAAIAGATLAGVQNTDGKIVIPAGSVRGWIRVVATVTTGPVLCGAGLVSRPKYTS